MTIRIKIIAGGIYGASGEVPVGAEFNVSAEPTGWAGRYIVLSDDAGLTAVTNPAEAAEPAVEPVEPLVAKHRGRGSYSIMRGDDEVAENLSKAEADDFNAMSDEDKAAFVAL